MGKDDKGYSVGFDLGGTKMLATLFDEKNTAVAQERKKTKAQDGPDTVVDRIIDTIEIVLDKEKVKSSELVGIGIGCPGMVDYEKGIVVSAPNLGWKNMAVRDTLKKKFDCPVELLNDVDAGTYGEYRRGAAKNARCVVGVFPGTGIGGGCVYDGTIVHGSTASCFEIGHIQVSPNGPLCGCGQRGCLEAVASRLSISAAAAAAAFRGEAPHLLAAAGTDLSNIRSGVIAQAIKDGDDAVERVVRIAAQWLGVGIGTVVNLMAPDVVVLGGGLVEAMPDLFREEIEASAKKKILPVYRSCKIVLSELMDDAVVTGAAAWVKDRVKNDT